MQIHSVRRSVIEYSHMVTPSASWSGGGGTIGKFYVAESGEIAWQRET